MKYLKRLVDPVIDRSLRVSGALLIEGPRASGKTETAKQYAKSVVNVDTDANVDELLSLDPSLLFDGPTPRLIDEWQAAPQLWNHVRRSVDQRATPGQFILTGSSTPADDATRHSGAGRFNRIEMTTMTLYESGEATGEISLEAIHGGEPARSSDSGMTLDALVDRICGSGFPAAQKLSVSDRMVYVSNYLTQLSNVDVRAVDGRRMDPRRVAALIRSLARNVATEVGVATLSQDSVVDGSAIGRDTATSYLDALTRSFSIFEQPAWSTHLRSRARQRSTPKRHLADPAMAVAALGASPQMLKSDLNLLGLLFESQVIHDLRALAAPINGEVSHYRDSNGLEVDAIITTPSGWGAVEVKLGLGSIDDAAHSLTRFAATVDTSRMGEPKYLAVVVPNGYGYRREDGVDVVPLTSLGP
jgi:predicted AAA+ superfamily ATPase